MFIHVDTFSVSSSVPFDPLLFTREHTRGVNEGQPQHRKVGRASPLSVQVSGYLTCNRNNKLFHVELSDCSTVEGLNVQLRRAHSGKTAYLGFEILHLFNSMLQEQMLCKKHCMT